jgi:hypothetical protein
VVNTTSFVFASNGFPLLNGEIFYSLKETKIMIEAWKCHYNSIRTHSSLGYQPPAPEAICWPADQPATGPILTGSNKMSYRGFLGMVSKNSVAIHGFACLLHDLVGPWV